MINEQVPRELRVLSRADLESACYDFVRAFPAGRHETVKVTAEDIRRYYGYQTGQGPWVDLVNRFMEAGCDEETAGQYAEGILENEY